MGNKKPYINVPVNENDQEGEAKRLKWWNIPACQVTNGWKQKHYV
jgi:hypothetical protein